MCGGGGVYLPEPPEPGTEKPGPPILLPAHLEAVGRLRVGVGSVQKTASAGRAVREGGGRRTGRQGDGADEAGAVVHSAGPGNNGKEQ